ncbi:hypothetical protein [Novosphingobium sp. 11B]
MSGESIESPLLKASEHQIKQILAHAEMFLAAQLQTGLAADQRALVLSGFLATAVVALVGAAGAVMLNEAHFLGYVALLTAAGLAVSLSLAIKAARPIDFYFAGNRPCAWEGDLRSGLSEVESLASQALHYDEMIMQNRDALDDNCKMLDRAMTAAFVSIVGGGAAFIAYFLVRDLGLPRCG